MAVDNSTGNPHAPGPQLNVADIVIIAVYFALNLAVGIWVREWCQGVGTGWHVSAVCVLYPRNGWCPLGFYTQPWDSFVGGSNQPFSRATQ